MGYFAAKILVVAAILLGGLATFPAGALAAARRARKKWRKVPASRGFTGTRIAGLMLHREGLSSVRVTAGAEPLAERYDARSGVVALSDEVAKSVSVHAVATAAFLVAKVTLHADADPDFVRGHRRAARVAVLANLFPAVLLAGVLVPGEGRVLLLVAAPVALAFLAASAAMTLPGERRAAERALALLDRHGFVRDETEREALRASLAARASLTLASPLTRCFWINWAL